MRSQKSTIVNKLLPLDLCLYCLLCRLLYVLNEFWVNKRQFYGDTIVFFKTVSQYWGVTIQSHFRIEEFKYITELGPIFILIRVRFSIFF